MSGTIFLSYRRDDSSYISGRIREHLEHRYGSAHVIFDVDSIPLGQDFRAYLNSQLEQCDVMLVVIGPRWLAITDQGGSPRLHLPDDFVRMEVEVGLERGIPVVPLLINGATIPDAALLPESLRSLVSRQSFAIRPDPSFSQDMNRLMDLLEHDVINLRALPTLSFKPNILFYGRSGVGMSTLINALFGKTIAAAGAGKPVTQICTMYEYDSLYLIDSPGWQPGGDFEREGLATELAYLAERQQRSFLERVHMLWYLIDAPSGRFTDYDEKLVRDAFRALPVIIVLTKCKVAREQQISTIKTKVSSGRLQNVVTIALTDAAPILEPKKPWGTEDLVSQTLDYFH